MQPLTFREGILAMPKYFSPEDNQDVDAVIQFEVSGTDPGRWWMTIREGSMTVEEGTAPGRANLTVRTPSEVWLRIMRGELNGAEAFLTGQSVAEGDVSLLMRFRGFFKFHVGPPKDRER